MSSNLVGADLERMVALSKQLDLASNRLGSLSTSANNGIAALQQLWDGPDAHQFSQDWRSIYYPGLRRAADSLNEAAGTVLRNRDAQDQTSAVGGSAPASGNSGSGGGNTDQTPGKVDSSTRISGTVTPTDPLFRGIHPNDIAQGSIGNCYMLTSLAVIADQNQGLIRNAVTDNGDGTFTVTFHERQDDGTMTPVEVTVTGEFPEYEGQKNDGSWVSIPSTSNGDNELWPLVFEKAWGQFIAESDDMTDIYSTLDEGGQSRVVMEAISGIPSESTTDMSQYSMDELAAMHDDGTAITLSSLNATDTGIARLFKETQGFYDAGSDELHTRHAYWIDDVNTDTDPPTIVVRNPWGYEDGDRHLIELTYEEFQSSFDRIDTNALAPAS